MKPFAGPGATPIASVSPASTSAAIPSQTDSEVKPVRSGLWSSSTSKAEMPTRSRLASVAARR